MRPPDKYAYPSSSEQSRGLSVKDLVALTVLPAIITASGDDVHVADAVARAFSYANAFDLLRKP